MRESVEATKAILRAWQDGERVEYRGEYTTHTLSTPAFTPPPNPFGVPKVLVGALGPKMNQMAAEVADGNLVMPFNSERHMRERTWPAINAGLAAAGAPRDDIEVIAEVIIGVGRTEEELEAARGVRNLLAFYGSTPAYRPVLDVDGWGELQTELNTLSKRGGWAEMATLITDEMIETIAVWGTPDAGRGRDRAALRRLRPDLRVLPVLPAGDDLIAECASAMSGLVIPNEVDGYSWARVGMFAGRSGSPEAAVSTRSRALRGTPSSGGGGEARRPATVFVKLPFDPSQREFVAWHGYGSGRGRAFIAISRARLLSCTARVVRRTPTNTSYVMVLEDLNASGCRFPSARSTLTSSTAGSWTSLSNSPRCTGRIGDRSVSMAAATCVACRSAAAGAVAAAGPSSRRAVDALGDQMGDDFFDQSPSGDPRRGCSSIRRVARRPRHRPAQDLGDSHFGNLSLFMLAIAP